MSPAVCGAFEEICAPADIRGPELQDGSVPGAGAVTLGEQHYPGDCRRFTEQAVRKDFLATLTLREVRRVMNPPRFIGCGLKP
jgi:hypothetical protein